MKSKLTTFSTLILGLGLPSLASATPNFVGDVQEHLSLTNAPACTLCHSTPAGGSGTATTPFGQALVAKGAVAYDSSKLIAALNAIAAENIDSNKNGTNDVEDLKKGVDPNASPDGTAPQEPVSYGCGASIMQTPSELAGLAVLGAMLVLARRRRG